MKKSIQIVNKKTLIKLIEECDQDQFMFYEYDSKIGISSLGETIDKNRFCNEIGRAGASIFEELDPFPLSKVDLYKEKIKELSDLKLHGDNLLATVVMSMRL